MTTPREHAAIENADIVRAQLRHLGPFRGGAGEAALDALLADNERLTAELDEWLVRESVLTEELLAAEAERDQLRQSMKYTNAELSLVEAEVERLREALTEIANGDARPDADELLDVIESLLRYSRAFTLDAERGETAAYKRGLRLVRRYRPETEQTSSSGEPA